MSCERPNSAKWELSMASQSSLHWRNLRKSLILNFKSVSLYNLYNYIFPYSSYLDPTCEFSSPKSIPLDPKLQKSIEKALELRFSAAKKVIQRVLKSAVVEQYGRVRVTDPDTDDIIWAAALRPSSEDEREASYVRVSNQNTHSEQ